MHLERMKHMVRVLRTVQSRPELSKRFDLRTWFDTYASNGRQHLQAQFESAEDKVSIPHNCGTTACAVGYAGLDPWFREQGFTTDAQGGVNYESQGGRIISSWNAVECFFDISEHRAEYFFSANNYPQDEDEYVSHATVTDVIDRIVAYMDDHHPNWEQ